MTNTIETRFSFRLTACRAHSDPRQMICRNTTNAHSAQENSRSCSSSIWTTHKPAFSSGISATSVGWRRWKRKSPYFAALSVIGPSTPIAVERQMEFSLAMGIGIGRSSPRPRVIPAPRSPTSSFFLTLCVLCARPVLVRMCLHVCSVRSAQEPQLRSSIGAR